MVCSSRRTVALSYPYSAKHRRAPSRIWRRRAARWSSLTRGILARRASLLVGLQHVAQHEVQDAAVAVVIRLAGGVDADHGVELDRGAVLLCGLDLDRLRRPSLVQLLDAGDVERLGAVEFQRRSGLALRKLQRDDAH